MGKKKKTLKVVLDTNVLISALLFSEKLFRLIPLLQERKYIHFFSSDTFLEFQTVLNYPKFKLSLDEIDCIIHEILPYAETVEISKPLVRVCDDPDDNMFIDCALAAFATYIVSGDTDLQKMKKYEGIKIVSPDEFLQMLDAI